MREPLTASDGTGARPSLARVALTLMAMSWALTFYPTAAKLVRYWLANDTYHFAFLIPCICILLVWIRRSELAREPVSPAMLSGSLATAAGLVVLVVGRLSGTSLAEGLSLVVTIWGLMLLLFGWRLTWALAFPLVFLLAMVPFWELLTLKLHAYFQEYSAMIGVNALQLVGIPIRREGVLIQLPNVTLEVAEACSGVNYLISVLCLGIPLAALFVRRWSKRLLIVAAAALIALLSNGVRVAMVSMFAYYGVRGANGDVHGPFALFRSLLVSAVGFAALFALISRFADPDMHHDSLWRGESESHPRLAQRIAPAPVVLATVLLCATGIYLWQHNVAEVPLRADLRTFPAKIGIWEAVPSGSFSHDLPSMDFDESLSRNYRTPDGRELNLFVGYFRTQHQGRELAGQTIRDALSGGERELRTIQIDPATRANDFLTKVGRDRFYVIYWYALDGRGVAHHYEEKLYSAWSSITQGRSNGAIAIVKAAARHDESVEAAHGQIHDFIADFLVVAKMYLPEQ